MGIDNPAPTCRWTLASARRDVLQGAFRIRVATSASLLQADTADVWDSGRIPGKARHASCRRPSGLVSGATYFWQVRSWNQCGVTSEWSDIHYWSMGLLGEADWQADWITPALEPCPPLGRGDRLRLLPTWWMRRTVSLDALPDRVHLGIVCLGYYELYVNGRRVGNEPLAPSVSKLDDRALCIVHDISAVLTPGENCIGIWCSYGWYFPQQFSVHEG